MSPKRSREESEMDLDLSLPGSGAGTPTKRLRSCEVSGCSRRATKGKDGKRIKCDWHQLWSWNCPSDTLAAMFDAQCLTVASTGSPRIVGSNAFAFPGSASPGSSPRPRSGSLDATHRSDRRPADLEKLLAASRGRIDTARRDARRQALIDSGGVACMAADAGREDPCVITDALVAQRMAEGLGAMVKQTAKALVGMSGRMRGAQRTLDIATPFALKGLMENMYTTGLLNKESVLKHLEEPHLLLLIQLFRVVQMEGRPHATTKDVEAFFQFMFERKDPMTRDLLFHKNSHVKPFVAAALKP
jgi:hypothetical protein